MIYGIGATNDRTAKNL